MKTVVLASLLLAGCAQAADDAGGANAGQSAGGSSTANGTTGGTGNAGAGNSGGSAAGGTGETGTGGSTGGANTTGGTSGASATGGHGGAVGTGGSGGAVKTECASPVNPGLPAGAPTLEPGHWTDITPADHVAYKGTAQTMIAQGIAIDPCTPTTIYWCTTPFDTSKGGLFKSTDAGGSWRRVGKILHPSYNGVDQIDEPLHVRIDPTNTDHLYVGDGVRGATQGFFVSWDGETFDKPTGWAALEDTKTMTMSDVYDVAVDPTDFQHVLTSFHGAWGWTDTQWNTNSGVLESTDGGETWIVHAPGSWGTGHAINFLYDPEHGTGDKNTWLLGTQGGGYFRTSNAGTSWTKVADGGIFHGGGTVYYSQSGVLYASGYPSSRRSTDNGLTWTAVGPSGGGTTCLYGDGQTLWTAPALGDNSYSTSPEDDGMNFTLYAGGAQTWHNGGPFEMTFDRANRILYSSNWEMGAMAMKLP